MTPSPDRLPAGALSPHEQEELERMGLMDHLEELRKRLIRAILALFVAFLGCFAYAERIYAFLAEPIHELLDGQKLVFTGVTDPFMIYIKVAALAAAFVASPVILWQAWQFISPGLFKKERTYASLFVFFGSVFFLMGGAFGFFIAFPRAAEFLLGVGEQFTPMLTIERYFSFLMTVILGLGVMFELPVLIFILAVVGVVTPRFLIRHFRWAVIIIFTISAVITPTPDVFNLCLFAVPTLLLYVLSVGAAALVVWRRDRE